MVEVQFKNTRKGYYRNSNKIKLEKGDIEQNVNDKMVFFDFSLKMIVRLKQ